MARRVIIAGVSSGCGKTSITCAVLSALKQKKRRVAAFKCGPDYIDPMFHEFVLGVPSGNLDPYFLDEQGLCRTLAQSPAEITVLEGAMGFFDGIGFSSRASSMTVAQATGTPVILVVDAKGMGCSVMAVVEGFARRYPIAGVIFNRMAASLYPQAAEALQKLGVCPVGYVPTLSGVSLPSRHLGLVTAGEIEDLRGRIDAFTEQVMQTVDLDALEQVAAGAAELMDKPAPKEQIGRRVRIGVAKDEAFCFLYEDNLRFLRERGAELVYFSPLSGKQLPDQLSGLILSGGYPELHAKALSENEGMRRQIRERIQAGLPCIAECGGFLYLLETLQGADGADYPMAGVIPGRAYETKRLKQFGYVELTAAEDQLLARKGDKLRAHEFHYWHCDEEGEAFEVQKASGKQAWKSGFGSKSLYAGFPHFYLEGNPKAGEYFMKACKEFGSEE